MRTTVDKKRPAAIVAALLLAALAGTLVLAWVGAGRADAAFPADSSRCCCWRGC